MDLNQYIYQRSDGDLRFQNSLPVRVDGNDIWKIMRDVSDGVAFIHNHMEIHRDIKPTNSTHLLCCSDGKFCTSQKGTCGRLRISGSRQKHRRERPCRLNSQEGLPVIEHQNSRRRFQPSAIKSIFGVWGASSMNSQSKEKHSRMIGLFVIMQRGNRSSLYSWNILRMRYKRRSQTLFTRCCKLTQG